jgi:Zinc-finger associated domain (zf-AD)
METVCRLCSTQSSRLEAIFSFKNGRLISDLISTLIPIRCDINDPYPKKVCGMCLDIINKAIELRETSFKTDESFRNGTFVILPEKIPTESTIKVEKPIDKGKRKDSADDNSPRKRQRTSTDNGCPYGCSKSMNDVEKLSTIEEKLDKLMESVGCVDKLKLKMDHLEKKVSSQEHDLQTNKTFITNCLENAIGSKPSTFPTKLCATNVSELNVVDRTLMTPANNDYFIKYLNNNIGKSPDYKSYMKRALEIIMNSDFKAQLSFANHIRNLHAYNVIAGKKKILGFKVL